MYTVHSFFIRGKCSNQTYPTWPRMRTCNSSSVCIRIFCIQACSSYRQLATLLSLMHTQYMIWVIQIPHQFQHASDQPGLEIVLEKSRTSRTVLFLCLCQYMVTNVHRLWRRIELHLCDNTINSYQCKLKTTYELWSICSLLLSSEQSCTHPCFLFRPLLLHSSSVNINPFSLVLLTSYNAFYLAHTCSLLFV